MARNILKQLTSIYPKPATIPPQSVQEPRKMNREDLEAIKQFGLTQKQLAKQAIGSTQVNFERLNIYREVDRALQHWLVGCLAGYHVIDLYEGDDDPTIQYMAEHPQDYIGKQVWSINQMTLQLEPDTIMDVGLTHQHVEVIEVHLFDHHVLKCTPNHPVMMLDGTYKEAQDLLEYDKLMPGHYMSPGHPLVHPEVLRLDWYGEKIDVYDITTKNNHNFVVKDAMLVVHNSAAELFADVACTYNPEHNATVWVTSESKKYEDSGNKLFEDLGMEEKVFDHAWTVGSYGDLPIEVEGVPGVGVVNIDDNLHPANVSRVDYKGLLVGFFQTPFETGTGMQIGSECRLEPPWKYIHFRLLGAKKKRPLYGDPSMVERSTMLFTPDTRQITAKYGTSLLINALPVYKRLRLTEDMVLMARLYRGIEKYIYKIGVKGMPPDAMKSVLDGVVRTCKQARALSVDPNDPKFDQRANPMACLVGSTEVRLCGGKDIPIKDLVNSGDAVGKHVWTINPETLKLEAKPIIAAAKTRENAQLVRVHIDNGDFIDCTPDHKFMLRGGSFKQAQYLRPQDSLMPLYDKLSTREGLAGYDLLYNPGTNQYEYAHRLVMKQKLGRRVKYKHVVHHVDFNKRNNEPANLREMETSEHWQYHASLGGRYSKSIAGKKLADVVGEAEAKRRGKAISKALKGKTKTVGGQPSKGKTLEELYGVDRAAEIKQIISQRQNAWLKGKTKDNYPELVELGKKHSKKMKAFFQTEKGKAHIEYMNQCRKAKGVTAGRYPVIHTYQTRTCACGCGTDFRFDYKKDFYHGTHKQYLKGHATKLNHKVTKVDWLNHREDTYDITVADNHNFALTSGIFVHNSVEDLFLPVWGDAQNDLAIEKIGGDANIRWLADLEEMRNQLAAALRCPLPLLGAYLKDSSGALGAEATSQQDIRFARATRRLQRALINGYTRLLQIHFAYQGLDPDPNLFEVHMAETSSQEELQMKQALDTSLDVSMKFLQAVSQTAPNVDRVEIWNYLNRKFIKLNDFDLQDYITEELQTQLPELEAGAQGAGLPPLPGAEGGEDLEGGEGGMVPGAGEPEMTIEDEIPREHKHRQRKQNLIEVRRGKAASIDFLAALPINEATLISKYDPEYMWWEDFEKVKVKVVSSTVVEMVEAEKSDTDRSIKG